ncbi:MAG: FtsX-like permease family protein [Cyclobacteriaceae bacterium]|nr:FtsX-like permease family protein [Cyclobacteriaceae bacterium]
MFQNYLKIAFRNLRKNTGYSIINIGGLAVGMAIAMLIGLWVYDELSFDKYFTNYDRLAKVMQHQTFNGVINTGVSIPMPLENELREKYGSDFTHVAISSWTNEHILSAGDLKITKKGNYVQPDFPEMFTLKMLKGTREGLKDQASIIISESTARALFGDADPINQAVQIDSKLDVKVTGVYEDLPKNTFFNDLEFISSWQLYLTSEQWLKRAATQWGNNSFQLFVQISPGADFDVVSQKIKNAKLDNAPDEAPFSPQMFLLSMQNWHLKSDFKEGKMTGGKIEMVWLFGIIGLFVLLLACINFMNLSTARSEKRAKEVGIRMTIGSVRGQLINQFLSESFLVVTLSFIVAGIIVVVSLSSFNQLADKKTIIEWANPFIWLICLAFIIITSLLAGSYPALYLSSFQPVKVLKGTFKMGRFAALPRKILVVIQFTVSVTLIIGTIIVYNQIQYSKDRPIGYNREGLISIQMKSDDFTGKCELLRNELKAAGAVEEMSESSSPITAVWQNNGGFNWEGKDPNFQTDFATIYVSHEYGKTINWQIREGRDFSHEFATDSSGVILNEAAIKFMGITDPLGKEITWGDDTKLHIVGIINDMIMQSPYNPVKQTIYLMNRDNANWINIRLNPNKSASESLAIIEAAFKRAIPSAPFDFKFIDAEYSRKFNSEERVGKLASVFAVLAIIISCLGLFGLASFVAEQRTKEIGIRKVLGASITGLWKMLSADFVVLVIISCFLAAPLAYYFLDAWLAKYKYHTPISPWIFIMTALGALTVTLATVSFQAIKAALMSPVKSLKSE